MDPQECLREVLWSLRFDAREEAADRLRDLADWLEKGGFPPSVGIVKGTMTWWNIPLHREQGCVDMGREGDDV